MKKYKYSLGKLLEELIKCGDFKYIYADNFTAKNCGTCRNGFRERCEEFERGYEHNYSCADWELLPSVELKENGG